MVVRIMHWHIGRQVDQIALLGGLPEAKQARLAAAGEHVGTTPDLT